MSQPAKIALKPKPARGKRASMKNLVPEEKDLSATVPLDDGTNTEFSNGVSRNGTVRIASPTSAAPRRPALFSSE